MSNFVSPSFSDFQEFNEEFTPPELELLGEDSKLKNPTKSPDFVKDMSAFEKGAVGAGARLMGIKRAIQEPLLKGGMKLRELVGSDTDLVRKKLEDIKRQRQEDQDMLRYIREDPAYKTGEFVTDAATGALVPFYKGASILGTVGKNILPNFLYGAATKEGSIGDRVVAGGTSSAGAGAATVGLGLAGKAAQVVVPRIGNKFGKPSSTQWQNPAFRAKQDLADAIDAPLSLGDITPGPGGVIRKAENWLPGMTNREPTLKAQGDALIAKLHPKNLVQEGMEQTGKAVKKEGDAIFAPVNAKIGKTSVLVPSDNMHGAVKELRERFPTLFTSEIKDTQVRDLLNNFADEVDPPALSFEEFRKIQQAVGKAAARAKDLNISKDIEKDALNLANKAYSKAYEDIASWGQSGTSKKTAAKYKEISNEWKAAMDKWKEEILPFENNSFYEKVMDPSVTPEQTLKTITSNDFTTARDKVVSPYLAKHSPETQKLFDTVKMMNRAVDNATKPSLEHGSHILDTLVTIGHPGIVGAQSALSKGSANPLLKDMYLSSFDDLLPAQHEWGMGDIGGALSQLLSTVPMSYGRENGEAALSLGALPYLLYKDLNNEEQSIGSMSSTRDQGGVK